MPAKLVSTLIALANHADRDGRGCYPSQDVLARYTRKSRRQVQRDVDDLAELGLIRSGDARFVAHIRADHRPQVWDLAMERRRPRDDTHDTPSPESGMTPMTARGDTRDRHGVTPMSPEPSLEPKEEPKSKDMATARAVAAHEDPQPGLFGDEPPPPSEADVPARTNGHKRSSAKQKIAWSTSEPPEQYDLDQLWAAFWRCYPKKVKPLAARKCWDKAITRADPRDLIDAAATYAKQQADPWLAQFTKHPTTWLNGGCWDDEPEPRSAAAGGHQGWRGPTDQSVYDQEF